MSLGTVLTSASDRTRLAVIRGGKEVGGETIGRVKSGSGKSISVSWDPYSHEVYVAWAGWTLVGKAGSAAAAMRKAEAWLYDK